MAAPEYDEHKLVIELQGSKEQIVAILKEITNKVEFGTYYYESQLQRYLNEYMPHKSCIKKMEFVSDPDCKR